jgi:hypothetical protein
MQAYAKTLMDPERFPPVRLGGETMIQTGLTTLHQVFSFNTGVGTSSSIVFHPRAWQPLLFSNTSSAPYTYSGASYAWNANNIATFQSLAASARVVSCKLKIYSTSSATNDNGTIIGGLCPRDDNFFGNAGNTVTTEVTGSGSVITNYNNVSSGGYAIVATLGSTTYGGALVTQGYNEFSTEDWSSTVPLKDGMAIFWLPQDPQTLTFTSDRVRQNTIAIQGSSSITNAINLSPIQDPFFCIGLTGAATAVVNIEVFLNFEYTTTSGASSIVATESGAMSSVESFSVVKKIGANLQNLTVPNPEGSLADKAVNLGKSILRGGVERVSNFIFGSSDVGKALTSFLD